MVKRSRMRVHQIAKHKRIAVFSTIDDKDESAFRMGRAFYVYGSKADDEKSSDFSRRITLKNVCFAQLSKNRSRMKIPPCAQRIINDILCTRCDR